MLIRFAMRVFAWSFLLLFLLGGTLDIRWKDSKNTGPSPGTAQGMTLHANLRLKIPQLRAFGVDTPGETEERSPAKGFSVLETLKQSFLLAYGEPMSVIPPSLHEQLNVRPQTGSAQAPLQLTPHSVFERVSHMVSLGPEPGSPPDSAFGTKNSTVSARPAHFSY